MKKYAFYFLTAVTAVAFVSVGCEERIYGPELPLPEGVEMAKGTALDPEQLFGVWQGGTAVGTTNSNYFEQTYKIEFQSVEDGEALLSHWYNDAATNVRDSLLDVEYTYVFNEKSVELTPKRTAAGNGATTITGVHVGGNRMVLYTTENGLTNAVCELTRTGDPEPAVTGVNRTLPRAGETVTISGRNLQFVDHVWLPAVGGEVEVTDFAATSRQIRFVMPDAETAAGSIRCESTGAHISSYTPAMFCHNCVFFHTFSAAGGSSPNYTGTEFENTIGISQSLFEKAVALSSANLPEGHSLTAADPSVVHPDAFLSFFGNTPAAWPVDTSLDPSGYIRFSFGDCIDRVIEQSGGLLTRRSKCSETAIEMDIYVYSNGEPVWNTGFISFRLDKDAQKSLTQPWFAQTAMWDLDAPVSFADGWQTFSIPLSAITATESDQYATLGALSDFLVKNQKQALIKLLNYQLDGNHPAQALESFQMNIADIRLVPSAIPANTRDE